MTRKETSAVLQMVSWWADLRLSMPSQDLEFRVPWSEVENVLQMEAQRSSRHGEVATLTPAIQADSMAAAKVHLVESYSRKMIA